MKIEIEWLSDESDCETCGSSWADGALVKFEDGFVLDLTPTAHCYAGSHYSDHEVYRQILEYLGHEAVEVFSS